MSHYTGTCDCRSTSTPMVISWVLVLMFCVCFNIRLVKGDVLSWNWILAPVVSLLGYWLLYSVMLLLKHAINQIHLQVLLFCNILFKSLLIELPLSNSTNSNISWTRLYVMSWG